MSNTGKYYRAFTWLARTVTKDTTTGQDKESFSGSTILWGSLSELSATRQLAFGMLNSQAAMVIRLRQYPTVGAGDRLRDRRFGQLLVIDGIMHDENELVCYCHKISEVE